MNFKFIVNDDLLRTENEISMYSGNMNTYTFELQFSEKWSGFAKFAVFIKNMTAYNVVINGNLVVVPAEILEMAGEVLFGVFGNSDGDEVLRLSTNMLSFNIERGSYINGDAPIPPSADVWEQLVIKTVPKIGENGNWNVYDMSSQAYIDTGVVADTSRITYTKDEIDAVIANKQDRDFILEAVIDESGNAALTFDKDIYGTRGEVFDVTRQMSAEGRNVWLRITSGLLSAWMDMEINGHKIIPLTSCMSDELTFRGALFNSATGNTYVSVWLDADGGISFDLQDTGERMVDKVGDLPDTFPSTAAVYEAIRGDVITEIANNLLVLEDRQDAQLGVLSEIMLGLPMFRRDNLLRRYTSSFSFISGDEASVIKDWEGLVWKGDDVDSDGVFTPQANTMYEVSVKCVGKTNGNPVFVARVGAV